MVNTADQGSRRLSIVVAAVKVVLELGCGGLFYKPAHTDLSNPGLML